VSIAPAETHQTSRLLNYITSPSVLIRSAVTASAAVPGIFPPVTLQALDSHGERMNYLPQRKWVDGSVSDDLPAKRLARLYGVNHYVVSQTNPHVIPFVTDGHRKQNTLGLLTETSRRTAREWFNTVTILADRADKRNGAITRTTSLLRSIVNQDYVGDINILPDYKFQNPLTLLSNPGEKQARRLIASGERCTWPKLEMIRQQTLISRKLDSILRQFQAGVKPAPN
jgi:NTE family protein